MNLKRRHTRRDTDGLTCPRCGDCLSSQSLTHPSTQYHCHMCWLTWSMLDDCERHQAGRAASAVEPSMVPVSAWPERWGWFYELTYYSVDISDGNEDFIERELRKIGAW